MLENSIRKLFDELSPQWDFILLGNHLWAGVLATGLARTGYRILWFKGHTPLPACYGLTPLPMIAQDAPVPQFPLEWRWGENLGLDWQQQDERMLLPLTGIWLDTLSLNAQTEQDTLGFGGQVFPWSGEANAAAHAPQVTVNLDGKTRCFEAKQVFHFKAPPASAPVHTFTYQGLTSVGTGMIQGIATAEGWVYRAQITPQWGLISAPPNLAQAQLKALPLDLSSTVIGEASAACLTSNWGDFNGPIWHWYPAQTGVSPQALLYNGCALMLIQYLVEHLNFGLSATAETPYYIQLFQARLQELTQSLEAKYFPLIF